MKKVTLTLKITVALLAIILPFFIIFASAVLLPSQYDNTFVGALDEKLTRLESIDEPKIVIVGGSSVAFGVDSEMIERYTGMPVVNFGLYAALGTKLMLDLSEPYINEGDIVILAPELDRQTLSLYFSSATTLRALDGNFSYLKYIGDEHYTSLLGESFSFAFEKLGYFIKGAPDPEGVYNGKNFNEYGDLDFLRTENKMTVYYDPNTPIDLKEDILSDDFADYLNEYIGACKENGASVYFSYCPMNSLALVGDLEGAEEFGEYLEEKLDCTFISYIEDYILDAGYFYDSNFHLNEAGVTKHTVNLTRDLLLELGIPKAVTEKVPEPPALPELDVRYFEDDENAKYFEYTKLSNGSYMITGIKEEYRDEKSLTLPNGYDTYKVTQVGYRAFANSSVEEIIVPENTNIRLFNTGSFAEAGSVRSLVMYYPHAEDILPPNNFAGVADGFTVYVTENSNYRDDYFWRELGLTFVFID